MPLEVYANKEGEKRRLETPKDEKRILNVTGEAGREDIKRALETFRENYKKRRADAIKEGRERGRQSVAEQSEGEKTGIEKRELNADKEYARLWDFQENFDLYHGEGGWKESYLNDLSPEDNLPVNEKMSIEAYVLTKQMERLEDIRSELMVQRIEKRFDVLFPEMSEPGKEENKEEKQKKIFGGCQNYFQINREQIDQYLSLNVEDRLQTKDKMKAGFFNEVFAELDLTKPELQEAVSGLFEELLSDYEDMQNTVYQLAKLNPKMVGLLSRDGMTEEEWLKKMAEEAEKELKEMEEEEKRKAELQTYQSLGQPASFDFSNLYTGEVSAAEKLAPDTRISISMVRPGEYKIRFPGNFDKIMESTFFARKVENEATGQVETMYFFHDPLLDSVQRVGEEQFKQMVNGVYLEHVMSDSVKTGEDYLGPDLNGEVLPDRKMMRMAELLFYPKKLDERPLTVEQAQVFQKLLLVLVSKANNGKGTGEYGDLLATSSRVALLELALTMDGASKAQMCYNYLMNSSADQLRNLSIEELCHHLGVPKNSGNYRKS